MTRVVQYIMLKGHTSPSGSGNHSCKQRKLRPVSRSCAGNETAISSGVSGWIPAGELRRRSSVGRAPRQEVCRWFESTRLHHRRDLLPRSRTERKPAEVVFPVRCTKAAGRSNLCIGWHRLCIDERMRPTYRRRAEKFRGWFGCRRVRRKSEAKPVDVEAAWWRLSLDKAAV